MIHLDDIDNYLDWSLQVKTELKREQLWDIVEEADEPPKAKNDEAAFKGWSPKNAKALEVIQKFCDCCFDHVFYSISSAKIAWDTLAAICALPKTVFNIPAGDGDNYLHWKVQVKAILTDRQLWEIVEGTNESPKAENDEASFKAWSHKNAMVLRVIRYSCGGLFNLAIGKITSAKIAWDILAAICALPKTSFKLLADDGDNYLDWSLQVKAILTDRQLWDIVEGTNDPPKVEKNDMALGLIQYSCFWFRIGLNETPGLDDKLQWMTSAKNFWDALAAICALRKNEESIAAIIECLELILAVIKHLDDVDNYKDWSLPVKTYLTDQQLWDIVEGTNEPDEPAFIGLVRKECLGFSSDRVFMRIPLTFRNLVDYFSQNCLGYFDRNMQIP